jgi:hypothetical protein
VKAFQIQIYVRLIQTDSRLNHLRLEFKPDNQKFLTVKCYYVRDGVHHSSSLHLLRAVSKKILLLNTNTSGLININL